MSMQQSAEKDPGPGGADRKLGLNIKKEQGDC